MRDACRLHQHGDSVSGEQWFESECILKGKILKFVHRLAGALLSLCWSPGIDLPIAFPQPFLPHLNSLLISSWIKKLCYSTHPDWPKVLLVYCSRRMARFPLQTSKNSWFLQNPLETLEILCWSLKKKKYLFLAMLGLCCSMQGFSSCGKQGWGLLFIAGATLHSGAQPLGTWASVVAAHRLGSCSSQTLEFGLSSCGARAYFFHHMWLLPGPGMGPMSPSLAGRFPSTSPPGGPMLCCFLMS